MRDDFVALILSHGRADRVDTYKSMRRAGYTGPIRILVDDEDETVDEYHERYPGEVVVFSKKEIEPTFDTGDNFKDKRGVIIYARNASNEVVKRLGFRYFIQLDDDYRGFYYRYSRSSVYGSYGIHRTMDLLLESMVEFLSTTPSRTIAMCQGGDHIGGQQKNHGLKRKAMNTFVCDVERPLRFFGRINEDVNTYATEGRKGKLFFTIQNAQVNQPSTQSNSAGMTDVYLQGGTYLKTFYSVMYAPSAVKVATLGDSRSPSHRIHHRINWNATASKIVSESVRKSRTRR